MLAVSIPQSGFGAFEPHAVPRQHGDGVVSIPQSGFGAFEPALAEFGKSGPERFQSLSRDSGRLNQDALGWTLSLQIVSIPQSGFGAFEQLSGRSNGSASQPFQSLSRDSGRLNPRQNKEGKMRQWEFQSLSRDSGRLNVTWFG